MVPPVIAGKSFHDLRGKAATRLAAVLSDEEMANIFGWEVTRVAEIRRLYVDMERVISATIARMEQNK